MAGGIKLKLEGFKKLEKKFNKLDAKVQKKALRPALRKGAKIIQKAAKNLVPVGSGRLRKSIKVKSLKRSRKGIGVMVKTGTRTELGIPKTDEFYYPAVLEWGSPTVRATYFMRKALDQNRGKSINVIGNELGTRIEQLAKV